MERGVQFLICLITWCLIVGCSKSTDDLPDSSKSERRIYFRLWYKTDLNSTILYPDSGCKIFIYYDIYTADITAYTYEGNGKLVCRDNEILPDQAGITSDINGEAMVIIPAEDSKRKITVYVECNYYEGYISRGSFPPGPSLKSLSYNLVCNPI